MKNFISILLACICFGCVNGQLPVSAAGSSWGTYNLNPRRTMTQPQACVVDDYFTQTLRVISQQHREETRQKIARQLADRNLMTADQVRQIIQQFRFDYSRIEFARYAYSRVVDPQNFVCITSMFQYPESIEVLEDYLGISLRNGNHTCNTQCSHQVPVRPAQNCGNSGNYYTMAPLNMQSFNALIRTLQAMSFDSSKLQVVKQELRSNYFSSMQIKQLMDIFTFESSKLEIAKLAYRQVVDPENYFVVNESFTFESSILELDRALYK